MIICNTEKEAAAAAALLAQVGKRCEVAVRVLGYAIHVSGPLGFEDGAFSVVLSLPGDTANGCTVFEAKHVDQIRRSKSGTLLVTLRTSDL